MARDSMTRLVDSGNPKVPSAYPVVAADFGDQVREHHWTRGVAGTPPRTAHKALAISACGTGTEQRNRRQVGILEVSLEMLPEDLYERCLAWRVNTDQPVEPTTAE
jgi:hypothetical protein